MEVLVTLFILSVFIGIILQTSHDAIDTITEDIRYTQLFLSSNKQCLLLALVLLH